jgi:hypothetical protein
MDDRIPKYTKVVACDGTSYPVAGCRLVAVGVSSHDHIFEYELRVIAPNGNEFPIERGLKAWSRKRDEPNWMSRMRDRITAAVMADEPHLDLRLSDPSVQRDDVQASSTSN